MAAGCTSLPQRDHRQLVEHQDEAEGHKHLVKVVAIGKGSQHRSFDTGTEQHDRQHGGSIGCGQRPAPIARELERQIGTDHEEGAVGEIDDAHHPECQGQAARDQKQQHAVLNAVEELDENRAQLQLRTPIQTWSLVPMRFKRSGAKGSVGVSDAAQRESFVRSRF